MSDFSIRVRRYNTPTSRGRVIQGAQITFTDVADEASVLTLTVPEAIAGTLPTPFYAGIEVRGPSGWVKPRNDLFTFHRRAGNQKDLAAIKDLSGVQYVADRLGAHKLDPTEFGDGEVAWLNASAGGVLADFLSRIPGTGITRDFTAAVDSAGAAWPTADKADHKAGQFASGKAILDALTAAAFCTWWSEGTKLVLRKTGTGVKRNIRIDPPAKDILVDEDTTETASKFYVVTDTEVDTQIVYKPELGAGPREAVVTVAGATTPQIALRMADPLIKAAAKVRRQITVNYDAASLPARPFVDFQVGDDFDVHDGVYRLVGIQVTKGDAVTVRLTFGEIFRTLAAKLASRTASLSLGSGPTSIGRPIPSTTTPPAGVLAPPTPPSVTSMLATITVGWGRTLTTGAPGEGFAGVIAEAKRANVSTWVQVGQAFERGGITFPASRVGAVLGNLVHVRLRAINTKGVLSAPSDVVEVEVVGIDGPDMEFGSVSTNHIMAGAIRAMHLAVGVGETGQRMELTGAGMVLFDEDDTPVVSLTTSSANVLTISQRNDEGQAVAVAVIDENGDAAFQNLDVSVDALFQGAPLIGTFADSQTNGVDLSDVAMFDRLARGVVAVGDIGTSGYPNVTHQRAGLASFQVDLRAGRVYRFEFYGNIVSEWMEPGSGEQLSMQVHWSTNTQSIVNPQTAGGGWSHARILNSGAEAGLDFTYPYIAFREFVVPTDDTYNVLVSLTNPSARAFAFFPGDYPQNPPRIETVDLMPIEAWARVDEALEDYSTRAYVASSGGSSGSTAPAAPKTVTKVWNATWSVLWGPSGSIRPGSGNLYDDGRMLQGGGSSIGDGRAGRVGFPALGISGKTIKGMWLKVRVRHTGLTEATLRIGTHGNTEPPSGGSPNLANQFTKRVKRGQTYWIPVPKSLWAAVASGSIRGFQFGGPNVNVGKSDYVILDGYPSSNAAGSSVRPQLKVTYQ
ncbi:MULTISPECIES: hypothetical protein [unclassified Microbacterium]|uniref:hypothetical protein n=1 Tax=unclassified Microbacterium TaxID=2609290 RepID=UPI003C2C2D13